MQETYIVASKRTPIGSLMGSLAKLSAVDLGVTALKAAVEASGLQPGDVEELYFGNVLSANLGQAPAKQVALKAGLPKNTPTTLINKVCASGTKATVIGAMSIRLGDADIVAVGGMESMSNAPHYLPKQRGGIKYGNGEVLDAIVRDGLQDVYSGDMMGIAGDMTAEKYGFSREEQDEYAIRSYKRAHEATGQGIHKDTIAPVTIPSRKGDTLVEVDEEPERVNYDKIPQLKPAFKKDGTVTAANAPGINDGAAAFILASEKAVKEHNLKPLARIVSWADAAREPLEFTVAPADAMPKALKKAGLNKDQIDAFEINEAFSVVALANQKLLELDPEKVNPLGGAVALGHPIGCSGARIIGSLITQLQRNGGTYGCVGICNGGGGASSLIIERL